jgi:hypothetical protein
MGTLLACRLRHYLDTRSARQRLWIVLAMLAVFAAVDFCVIAWNIRRLHIEHIQPLNP